MSKIFRCELARAEKDMNQCDRTIRRLEEACSLPSRSTLVALGTEHIFSVFLSNWSRDDLSSSS